MTWLECNLALARAEGRPIGAFCIWIEEDVRSPRSARDKDVKNLLVDLRAKIGQRVSSPDQIGWHWSNGLALIEPSAGTPLTAYRRAKELLETSERLIEARHLPVKVTVGVALYPDDGTTASSLLSHAREAAGRAMRQEDSCFCFYSRATGRKVAEALSADVELWRALRSNTVNVHFQPILDLHRFRINGMLGEPSWKHSEGERSFEATGAFVETARMSSALGDWLSDIIEHQLSRWSRSFGERRLGFRLCRSQLADASLSTTLSRAIKAQGLAPDRLEIMVDSDLLLDATDHRLRTGLQQIADLGVQLTLSNVGAGPLPIEALTKLPFQAVELSPMLMSAVGRCATAERILAALINFARTMGLRSRATAVTSDQQLSILRKNQCDEATGRFLMPSLKGPEIERLAPFQLPANASKASPDGRECLLHIH